MSAGDHIIHHNNMRNAHEKLGQSNASGTGFGDDKQCDHTGGHMQTLCKQQGAFLQRSITTINQISLSQIRLYSLLCAILLYGAFGTPTPDKAGLIEILIAAFLVFAVNSAGISALIHPPEDLKGRIWFSCARALFLYGISMPLLCGIAAGHAPSLILRDSAALVFIMLPLLMAPLILEIGSRGRQALWVVSIVAGVMLAARDLAGILSFNLPMMLAGERLSYLSNSPLVLMAAIALGGYEIYSMLQARHWRGVAATVLCFAFMLIPMMAMGMGLQRASIGLWAVAMALFLAVGFWHRPARTGLIVLALAIIVYLNAGLWADALAPLWQKSAQVGLNMRSEELLAVWQTISRQQAGDSTGNGLISLFFGLGWGGTFQSPAVGMMQINFTHGLIGSALLKTGLCGLALYAAYLFTLGKAFLDGAGRGASKGHAVSLPALIVLLALLCPFVIDIFLYAAFKSLDFGIVLLLMAITAQGNMAVKPDGLVKATKLS